MGSKRRPEQRKLRTREHVLADLGVNFVERQALACGFSVERVSHDYGIDVLMFTYNAAGEIENGHVEIQVKATDHPRYVDDGESLAIRIQTADIAYWQFQPMPVILVVYDATREQAFWIHIQESLQTENTLKSDQERVTVKVPADQLLTPAAMRHFQSCRTQVEVANRKRNRR